MADDTFDILFLIARPAAGKSEIIEYLKGVPEEDRRRRFHVGRIAEFDDFPLLWAWFEEDHLLEQMGHPRLHTDADGCFLYPYLWDVLISRLCLEYSKLVGEKPSFHPEGGTAIVEFSRGRQHGGFRQAFQHVPIDMLRRGAVLHLDVSWEESLRKNRARFNPQRPHSILEHSLPDAKLEALYRESDWTELRAGEASHLRILGVPVPYAVFQNEDDVTTARGEALGSRLEAALDTLWHRRQHSS